MVRKYLLVLIIFLVGCTTATMVLKPGASNSNFAPSNEATRPGLVKYLNQGADFVIKGRREDAYKQMHSACNGNYQIINEGAKADGGVIINTGTSAVFSQSEYWYIAFLCEFKK